MNVQDRNRYILVFFIVYIIVLLNKSIMFVLHDFQRSEMYSNWLINYRGGFMRRGLSGSIILYVSSILNISTTLLTNIICASAWLFVLIFFVTKFVQRRYPLFILSLPFFIGETILIDPSCCLRKDCFCLMIFIIMLQQFFSGKYVQNEWKVLFFKINILFIIGILIHEVIFFFAFPILFFSHYKKAGSLFKSLLFFMPSIFAFLCCEVIPSDATAREMLRLTPQIDFDDVGFLFTKFYKSFVILWGRINNPPLWFSLFYLFGWILAIYFVCMNFHRIKIDITKNIEFDCRFLSRILMFQFLSISPLFCCTWDWGRWMFLWVASSFAYFLIAETNPFEGKIFEKTDLYRLGIFQKISKNSVVVFAVSILINCQYMLPFEKEFFIHSPAFEVLNAISKIIYFIIDK